MGTELSYKTAVCTEYERLLFVCVKSLDSWRNRREEIANLGLKGKEVGDELLRLQADYAKTHSRLEKHEDNCELCQFVSKIGGRGQANTSTGLLDKRRSA